jgi:hypothetical protein
MSSDPPEETRTTPQVAPDASGHSVAAARAIAAPPVRGRGLVGSMRAPSATHLALALYLLLSSFYFGRQALAHLGSVMIAPNDVDPSQYQWFLAWWPHAILHGLNPFITHAVYVPEGYNLTWTTSLAGPALLFAPVTLLFGPTVTFNIFSLLAPTLSAWMAFLLCRHVTGKLWPSLLAGYVFGFSGFMLTAMQGEPWLAFVALLPAFVLLVLKRLEGSLGRRAFVGLMGAGVVFQFTTSAETLATATLFGGFALIVAYALFPEHRAALRAVPRELALAYLAAAVVLSPFLYFMLKSHTSPLHATLFVGPTDPISYFVPSQLQARGAWQAGKWAQIGVPASQDTFPYLGLPLVVIIVVFAVRYWRERSARMLTVCFAALVVAVMGTRLVIVGDHTGLPLPWALFRHLPLLKYALPFRAAVYSSLLAAVILAVWLGRRQGAVRWGAALLAVAALLPNLSSPVWHSTAVDPPFFQHGEYKAYLSATDNVLTIPVDGQNERWQARTRFAFNIVGGYLGAFPDSYTRYAAWNALLNGKPSPHWPQALRTYLAAKRATAIVVDKRYGDGWRQMFAPLGITPVDTGGVLLYRLLRRGQ